MVHGCHLLNELFFCRSYAYIWKAFQAFPGLRLWLIVKTLKTKALIDVYLFPESF